MIEGEPGTAFEDEVVVRRLRFASEDTGFAVIDAERDGDDIVLVGPLAHLEERERVRIEGVWQDDRRFGMQVKVRCAEPVRAVGRGGADRLPQARQARRRRRARRGCSSATATACWRRSTPTRAARSAPSGLNPKRVNEAIRSWNGLRSTPRAAPAARAARAGLARAADRGASTATARTTSCASGRTS